MTTWAINLLNNPESSITDPAVIYDDAGKTIQQSTAPVVGNDLTNKTYVDGVAYSPTIVENVGSGYDIIQDSGSNPVYVKTLIAGSNVSISDSGSDLTINASSSSTDVENSGAGYTQLVENPGSNPVYIKNLYSGDSSITFYDDGSYIDMRATGLVGPQGPQGDPGPQGPPGNVNDIENTGSGAAVVENPGSNSTIYIKGMNAGSNMTITDYGSYLQFDASGSSSTDVENSGAGYTQLVENPGSNPVYIKNLYSGDSSITFYDDGSYIDMRATGLVGPQGPQGDPGPQGPPGNVNDIENTGSGAAVVENPGSNSTIYIKGMNAGSNMTITDYGSYLQFDASGSSGSYPNIYNNGSSFGAPSGLNFTGNSSVSYSGYGVDINIGDPLIYNNGANLGNQPGLNFYNGLQAVTSYYGADITATYSVPMWNANQLQSYNVSTSAPADQNVLTWVAADGQWEPQALPTYIRNPSYLVATNAVINEVFGTGTSVSSPLQVLTIPGNTLANVGEKIVFGSAGTYHLQASDTIHISTYFNSELIQTFSRTASAITGGEDHVYQASLTLALFNNDPGVSQAYGLALFTDNIGTTGGTSELQQDVAFIGSIDLTASNTISTEVTLISTSSYINSYYSNAEAWTL